VGCLHNVTLQTLVHGLQSVCMDGVCRGTVEKEWGQMQISYDLGILQFQDGTIEYI